MSASAVIQELAGSLAESLDLSGLADDGSTGELYEKLVSQLLAHRPVAELAVSLSQGIELLAGLEAA